MKTSLFTSLVLFTIAFVGSAIGAGEASFGGVSASKPIKDVKNKNPLITHRYSADPGVMVYNGRVYVYSSNDGDVANKNLNENKYDQINSINCMSSADLVNWMDHGPIPAAGASGPAKWAKNSWAPTAAYKKINGKDKFFLYFADNGSGIGVLTSDSPTGPFTDPIGKQLVSRQTPTCASVTWLFDPAVFVDDDGTGYLYFGGGVPTGQSANPKTVRVVKLGPDMISLAGNPEVIDAPWVFEDSGITKVGSTYIYSYCTNWDNGPHGNARIAYMTSNSPMGPFTFKGTCFNNPGDFFGTTGNNHHTIIQFKDKYYIFYHAQWLEKQVLGTQKGYRTTHVDEMPIVNGAFGQAKGTLNGPAQLANVDGSALNYAACFAWQSGISVKGQGAVTQVNYSRGGWTGVSNVDLGGASSITLKASSQSGATIKICTESENGQAIGYVDIPAGGSLQNVTGNITGVSGTKNLFFVASGDATIESWQLGAGAGGAAGSANTAPAQEQAPAQQQAPVQEQAPAQQQAPVQEQAPAQQQAPQENNNNPWGGNMWAPQENNNNPWGGNQWNQWGGNQWGGNQWGGNQWGGNQWAADPAAAEPAQNQAPAQAQAPAQQANNNGQCAGLWAQCGGNGYSGPTCCKEGKCEFVNEWFSMCK